MIKVNTLVSVITKQPNKRIVENRRSYNKLTNFSITRAIMSLIIIAETLFLRNRERLE